GGAAVAAHHSARDRGQAVGEDPVRRGRAGPDRHRRCRQLGRRRPRRPGGVHLPRRTADRGEPTGAERRLTGLTRRTHRDRSFVNVRCRARSGRRGAACPDPAGCARRPPPAGPSPARCAPNPTTGTAATRSTPPTRPRPWPPGRDPPPPAPPRAATAHPHPRPDHGPPTPPPPRPTTAPPPPPATAAHPRYRP